MTKLESAISNIHKMDQESQKRRQDANIRSIAYFITILSFIIFTVSFSKYDLLGLLGMFIYLIMMFIVLDLSFLEAVKRLKYIFVFVIAIGLFNPLFDQRVITGYLTYGVLSMMTLWIKSLFCVLAGYIMMMILGIEGVCYSLKTLHIPEQFITLLLLLYRYIIVFLKEIERMMISYRLRAPKAKGLHISSWGPFTGLLLLHSIDRAKEVYQCMKLRGYQGIFYIEDNGSISLSVLFVGLCLSYFIINRIYPIFLLVGGIL